MLLVDVRVCLRCVAGTAASEVAPLARAAAAAVALEGQHLRALREEPIELMVLELQYPIPKVLKTQVVPRLLPRKLELE